VALFLPLIGFFTRSATSIVAKNERLDDFEPRSRFIDFRVVNTPPLAILQARREMLRMAAIAGSMFDDVAGQFHRYDAKRTLRVRAKEDALDALYRDISQFLVQLSRQQLSPEVSLEIPILLEVTKHLEHLGDQNLAVLNYLTRKKEEKIIFSSHAMTELRGIAAQVAEMVRHAGACLEKGNGIDLADAWTLKNAIDEQREAMNANHIKRMTSGKCTVMAGLVYGDLLSAFGRIAEYSFGIIKIRKELA
jgi:phosphate:Na+ symporter